LNSLDLDQGQDYTTVTQHFQDFVIHIETRLYYGTVQFLDLIVQPDTRIYYGYCAVSNLCYTARNKIILFFNVQFQDLVV
jgi:hypothetical protein